MKSASLNARIEPSLKESAEGILSALGISASNAIAMFYTQVVICKGLPFDVKLPSHPLDMGGMSKEELNAELEKGYKDIKMGRTKPASEVFDAFNEEMNQVLQGNGAAADRFRAKGR